MIRAAVLVLAVVCATAASAQDLRQRLQTVFDAADVVGMSVATVERGRTADLFHFGLADATTGRAVDGQTVFEAASLSKPVTAVIALRMAERGELDLDAPLWDHLEYDRLADDPLAPRITARMVLSHTSGLPNWGGTPLQRNRDPGSGWGYSGEGYVFLQRVIETIAGMPLNDVARREIFGPAGMSLSSFVWRPDYRTLLAPGHDRIGDPQELRERTEANAAASLYTTASDYARFLRGLLGGFFLESDTRRDMFTAQPGAQVQGWGPDEAAAQLQWGLGLGLQPGRAPGKPMLWHWGDNGTYRSFVLADPGTASAIVYFSNSLNGASVAEDVVGAYFDEVALPSIEWLENLRYDDPKLIARIESHRVFAREGLDAGLAWMAAYEQTTGAPIPEGELRSLAGFLSDREQYDVAAGLLETVVATRDSVGWQMHRQLGMVQTLGGAYASAVTSLARALRSEEADRAEIAGRLEWLGVQLGTDRGRVDPSMFEAFAGKYGPRVVVLDEGVLYYAREGATERTRMVPLDRTRFGIASSPGFRLRFVLDENDTPIALSGEYLDGRSDETPRDADED